MNHPDLPQLARKVLTKGLWPLFGGGLLTDGAVTYDHGPLAGATVSAAPNGNAIKVVVAFRGKTLFHRFDATGDPVAAAHAWVWGVGDGIEVAR